MVLDFDDGKWKEAEQLFPHDVALLLDKDKKQAYFWTGMRAGIDEKDEGLKRARDMMEKYKLYELIALGDSVVPLNVQNEVEKLLGENANFGKAKVERSMAMRIFIVIAILGILTSFALLIQSLRMTAWDDDSFYYEVLVTQFQDFFEVCEIIAIVAACLYLVLLIVSIPAKKFFLSICALTSFAIMVGTVLYIGEGELIFNYGPFLLESMYYIERPSVAIHLVWIGVSFLTSSLSSLYAILVILKQSEIVEKERIGATELELKSRPSILRDREKKIKKIETPQ